MSPTEASMDPDADAAPSQRLNRRDFVVMAGVAGIAAGAAASRATAQSETGSHVVAQPTASPSPDADTSDTLVEALIGWGASHVFGIVATAFAKHTGRSACVSRPRGRARCT